MGRRPELYAANPAARDLVSALVGVAVVGGWLVFVVALVVGNVLVVVRWVGLWPDGLGLLGLADMLLLAVMGKVTMLAVGTTEKRRRRHGYAIGSDDYADAPQPIKDTMRQLFAAAESLRTSRAYRDGMFGDLGVDQVLHSASERAVQASEINRAKRRLEATAGPADEDALRRARVALRKVGRLVHKAQAELAVAAKAAKELSAKLDEADRVRADARQEELAAERRPNAQTEARTQAESSVAQAKSLTRIDTAGIADRVNAVAAGYDEARKVSDDILRPTRKDATEPPPSLVQIAWKAARSAVDWLIHN